MTANVREGHKYGLGQCLTLDFMHQIGSECPCLCGVGLIDGFVPPKQSYWKDVT